MIDKVRATIEKFNMIRGGDCVAAAVSGGADSVAMLHALHTLSQSLSFKLVVCHLNHNLRGEESQRDFDFVKSLCERLGLEFIGEKLKAGEISRRGRGDRKKSTQEAARSLRYRFLESAASRSGADKVALGHTLDDQAETVLMRFIKGSALAGLCGMQPVRAVFVRPLIETSREEVERYLETNGLEFVTDSSNKSRKYLRNDVRLSLIPFIEKNFNSNIKPTLARTAAILATDDDFIRQEAEMLLPDVVKERKKGVLTLDRKRLTGLHEALPARIFLYAIELLKGKSNVYSSHVHSFLKLISAGKPNARLNLPGGLTVKREYELVRITLESAAGVEEVSKPFDTALKVPGMTIVPEAGCTIKTRVIRKRPKSFEEGAYVAFFDYDKLVRPLRVRSFVHGDKLVPLGMTGHKKLKEIFIEQKVPRGKRGRVPVLTAAGEVIWAVGFKRTEHFKVEETTRRILRVESVKGVEKRAAGVERGGKRPVEPSGKPAEMPEAAVPETAAERPEEAAEKKPSRRRSGRPRRRKPPETAAEAAKPEEPEKAAGKPEEAAEKKPSRRRSGRPRRRKPPEKAAEAAKPEEPEKAAAGKPQEAAEKKPSRRRSGRPRRGKPPEKAAEAAKPEEPEKAAAGKPEEAAEKKPSMRRSGRPRRGKPPEKAAEAAKPEEPEKAAAGKPQEAAEKKPSRRRSGRPRRGKPPETPAEAAKPEEPEKAAAGKPQEAAEKKPSRRRSSRPRRRKPPEKAAETEQPVEQESAAEKPEEAAEKKPSRRRSSRPRRGKPPEKATEAAKPEEPEKAAEKKPTRRPRKKTSARPAEKAEAPVEKKPAAKRTNKRTKKQGE